MEIVSRENPVIRCWIIKKQRTLYWCEVCHQLIDKPHVYLYAGYPKPFRSHICLECATMEGITPGIRKVALDYQEKIRKMMITSSETSMNDRDPIADNSDIGHN
jgi:hypothetical protein